MSELPDIDYARIFQHAPVGMCVSQHRVIHACNDAMRAMFGYPPAALIGQSFALLYPTQAEFERAGARIAPIMRASGCYADERIMRRADYELFWCRVSGRALHTGVHAIDIWMFEDLSDRRPVTARLTPREREVAAFLVEGKTSKLIAREMGLSPRTVEMHRAKLMRKFGAATSSDLLNRLLGTRSSS
ncbi:MAG TPA: LuxR C-terminal-related transcriptional regulator [Oxalicibacterium sp.]|jgi:PAS domain S-box-containing protein|nr:LuxR C-terminal-related transcriptional regulator [Oxalicibacterium sp.]